jgi:hypothetical protein
MVVSNMGLQTTAHVPLVGAVTVRRANTQVVEETIFLSRTDQKDALAL